MNRERAFALTELLIALAVVGVAVGVASRAYSSVRESNRAEAQAQWMVNTAASIRRSMGKTAGSYNGLSPVMVQRMGLVRAPMRWDGVNLLDAWGNGTNVYGAGPFIFSILIGGPSPISQESCVAIATRLASSAFAVFVGNGAYMETAGPANGWVQGGVVSSSNNGDYVDVNALAAGCADPNPKVGATWIER